MASSAPLNAALRVKETCNGLDKGYEGRIGQVEELAQALWPQKCLLMPASRSEEQAQYPKGKETVSVVWAI
jgi:hypothetical protein